MLLFTRRLRERWFPVRRPKRGCRACGFCCEHFGGTLRACKTDLRRWEAQGRADLLERVGVTGRLWKDPESGGFLEDCPYLEKAGDDGALCGIHETKPQICRDYPTLAHGKRCVRGVLFD